jgi:lysozyme family protein
MKFEDCLRLVLKHEGGFSNHRLDPGGATNRGVTKRAWEAYVQRKVSVDDIRRLTVEDVTPFYRDRYWIYGLPNGVDYVVFDASVNSGPYRASRWLQECVGAVPDGIVGLKTLAAVELMEPRDIIIDYCAKRMLFLRGLDTWDTFGKGWSRRVKEVEATALDQLGSKPDTRQL